MAETMHRNPDVTGLETYPTDRILPERVAGHAGGTALEEQARQLGTVLGNTVVTLRNAGNALQQAGSQAREMAATGITGIKDRTRSTGTRINQMAETAKNKTRRWGEAAASSAQQLRQATAEKAQDVRSQVKTGYYQTRLRANQFVREYPLHLVLTAGAVGFLLGVGLRIWRSNHEH